jgi:hypothetical protein
VQEQGTKLRTRLPMRIVVATCAFAAVFALAAGCGGHKKAKPAATTPSPADQQAATAVFERSYSECSTTSLQDLAAGHHVQPTWNDVAAAVSQGWVKRFGGGAAAQRSGRDGCIQALRSK